MLTSKETGLLFTPENYDKTARGLKWMTRRIIKPQPEPWEANDAFLVRKKPEPLTVSMLASHCSYGTVGDRLYCKEAHYLYGHWNRTSYLLVDSVKVKWSFAPHRERGVKFLDNPPADIETDRTRCGWFKRSPLFMEKAYARLWLEITDVEVERLQEITETDAIAEGCCDAYGPDFHVGAFRRLWESIHGPGSWNINPWVWVLTYRKVEA